MLGIGVGNGLFVTFGGIRQPLYPPQSQGFSRQTCRADNVHDFSFRRSNLFSQMRYWRTTSYQAMAG